MKPRRLFVYCFVLWILVVQISTSVAQDPYALSAYSGPPDTTITIYNYYAYPSTCYVQGREYNGEFSSITFEDFVYLANEDNAYTISEKINPGTFLTFYCDSTDKFKAEQAAGQLEELYKVGFEVTKPDLPPTDTVPPPQTSFVNSTTATGLRSTDGCAANATTRFQTSEDTIYLVARANNVLKGQSYYARWNVGGEWVYPNQNWTAKQYYNQLCMSFSISPKDVYFQPGNWYAQMVNADTGETIGSSFTIELPPTDTPRPLATFTLFPTRFPTVTFPADTPTFVVLTVPPTVIPTLEAARLPDLALENMVLIFADNQAHLDVHFANRGNLASDDVRVSAEGNWDRTQQSASYLNPGDSARVQLALTYPEGTSGQNDTIKVTVEQTSGRPEQSYTNNSSTTTIAVPPPCAAPLICIVQKIWDILQKSPIQIAITVGAGTILTFIARKLYQWTHKIELFGGLTLEAWEQRAQPNEPSQPCDTNQFYCKKVKADATLAYFHVACLHLTAHDPTYHLASITREVKGRTVEELNRALDLYRRGQTAEKLQQPLGDAAYHLLREITAWLGTQPGYRDVVIAGHLEGSEVKFTFTLYKCVRLGPQQIWKITKKWTKKFKDKKDLSLMVAHEVQKIGNPPDTAPLIPPFLAFIEQI